MFRSEREPFHQKLRFVNMTAKAATILAFCLAIVLIVLVGSGWFDSTPPMEPLDRIELWTQYERWELAEPAISLHLESEAPDSRTFWLAARIAAGKGQLDTCIAYLERIPAESEFKAEALLRQGQAALKMNRAAAAENYWLELIAVDARREVNHAALRELAALVSLQYRSEQALNYLWRLYPEHGEKWRLLVAMSQLQATSNRARPAEKAIIKLQAYLAEDPKDWKSARGIAAALVDQMNWRASLDMLQQCPSNDPFARELRVAALLGLGDWESAKAALPGDLEDRPKLWKLDALLREKDGDIAEARRSFEKSLTLNGFDPQTHYQFAEFLARAGDADGARTHFDRHTELKQADQQIADTLIDFGSGIQGEQVPVGPKPQQCVRLANLCITLGRRREARGWAHEAIAQDPDSKAARKLLDRLAEPRVSRQAPCR